MLPIERERFPSESCELKDGRRARVRFLVPADAEALAEFYSRVPREDFRFYSPHGLTAADAKREAENLSESSSYVCLVAEEESSGQIVGYAWYVWQEADSPTSYFGICIRKDYQGAGTGHALMQRLLKIAETVGPPKMSLTVQMANQAAVTLYQKMGFRVVREQTRQASWGFEEEPEYFMERSTR